MPDLLYSIIIKISILLKEDVHCQGIKLHRKSSTLRKHLNSMTSLKNLNTKLIANKSRRPQRLVLSRHKPTSFIKKNLFSVISKRILYASQNEMSLYSDESDNESIDDMDSSFVLSESDSSSCSDFDSNDNKDETKSMAFIVFWSSLIILFRKCFTCFEKSIKITRKVHGSLLIITMTCSNGHKNIWRSQPSINHQSLGNISISLATLFSANTFQRIIDFFHLVGIQCMGKTRFYEFQRRYLAGVVQERYCKEKNSILNQLKEQGSCRLSRDGRCDSPGHNAKYLTLSWIKLLIKLLL